MHTLNAELTRLFGWVSPDSGVAAYGVSPQGLVRALVLELAKPAEWALVSAMYHAVRSDLGLPVPAIAVSGTDAYQLWFSVREPVQILEGRAFLSCLRARYWPDVADDRVRILPSQDPLGGIVVHATPPPILQEVSGNWSAFVSPGLASLFEETPWLDTPPSPDAQADVLSQMQSIKPAQFLEVMSHLAAPHHQKVPTISTLPSFAEHARKPGNPHPTIPGNDPRAFLLRVMNDPSVDWRSRVEAAKALLPYAESTSYSVD